MRKKNMYLLIPFVGSINMSSLIESDSMDGHALYMESNPQCKELGSIFAFSNI
jgi:hypothetical protein